MNAAVTLFLELFAALRALIEVLRAVIFEMRLERMQLIEGSAAIVTLIRALAGMDSHVLCVTANYMGAPSQSSNM